MPPLQRSRFVGRDPELALLRADLAATLAGEGRVIALLGEPGIGKTRTATLLATEASARGMAVAWGRCHEGDVAPAYWPWTQAVTSLATQLGDDDGGDARLAALVSRLRGDEAAAEVPARARFALLEHTIAELLAAARARPLLVVFDDLHWADLGSLLVLERVAREVAADRLLLVVTLREAEARVRPDRAALVHAALRLARTVHLGGLSRGSVHELLADHLGSAPDAALVDRVHATSDGNPFFVLEMAQLLASSGTVGLPAGVAALFGRRLAPLPPSCRRALEAAALIGQEFALDTLASVLDESPAQVLDTLAPAIALGLLRAVPGRLRQHAFAHALLREALEAALPPRERTSLHQRIGHALAGDARDHAEVLPRLAHHFLAAADGGGDAREAAHWACAAGEHALRSLAFEEAARQFVRAHEVADLARDEALRLRALLGLAGARHGAGETEGAEQALQDAIRIARRGDGETFARTALRCAAVRAEIGVLDVDTNALLEEALDALPPEPGELRARLLARLAAGLLLAPGSSSRRRALSDEATTIARVLGDRATLAFVLSRRLTALVGPDILDERRQTLDELARIRSGDPAGALDVLTFQIGDLAEAADRQALDLALASFARHVQSSRDPFHRWTDASFRAAVALLEGRYAEAEALAAEALESGRGAQARSAVLGYAQQLFLLRGEQGRLDEVEPLLRAGASETAVVPAWRCGLADFYSAAGRDADARRELDALATDGLASLPRDAAWLTSMALLASACTRLRDTDLAAALYAELLPYAGRIAIARPLVVFVGLVDERLGALASLLGRFDAAERHLASAHATASRMRALPWQAHVLHARAEMLRRRDADGDRTAAAAALDAADAIARPLGMALLGSWIAATRRTLGRGDAATAAASAAGVRHATFRREGAVWTLVFEQRVTRLKHMVGLAHLARLLATPSREVHVIDLIAGAHPRDAGDAVDRAALGDAGEQLDARARADYAARLRRAREELEESRAAGDLGRCESLTREIDALGRELARGYGLDGRARRAGSAPERARIAVTRAIKYAIDRIAEHDPGLAEHLGVAVRTGVFCAYAPPSRDRVVWALEPESLTAS